MDNNLVSSYLSSSSSNPDLGSNSNLNSSYNSGISDKNNYNSSCEFVYNYNYGSNCDINSNSYSNLNNGDYMSESVDSVNENGCDNSNNNDSNKILINTFNILNSVDSISVYDLENLDKICPDDVFQTKEFTANVFLVSDNPGTNILDLAATEILNQSEFSDYELVVRSGDQIGEMSEEELYDLMSKSDIFIAEWVSSNVDAVLTSFLGKYPEMSNKKLFLILEPPVGNLSSTSTSIGLVRNTSINYQKIFNGISNDDLVSYFQNTKRGTSYSDVYEYLTNGNGKNFNQIFNKFVLYKDINDKENLKNQIFYALNTIGYGISYSEPSFNGLQSYGIYRDKWYSLDEYITTFFNKSNNRTVGILESTMYISSQQLQTCYEVMESLESKGYNVIPVFAAGGSADQLKTMVKYFTSAGDDITGFLTNSSKYEVYVDAIVCMVAYGVGGENFTNATNFFEEAGVPVFRAVHSDYISNEHWELSSTGLTTEKSDKWWHVTISEAQGIFDATFIGGASTVISNYTGARITGYVPHEKNIDLLTDRIDAWVDLQYTANPNKLISIIYYNYPPGKQNIGSSYLDSITSIYNMLYTLKAEGYNLGELPSNVSELEEMMITCGINVANWAPGELEKLANQSGITLLPVSEYMEWFNSLDDIVKLQVSEGPVAYIGELVKQSVQLNYTLSIYDIIDDWYNQIKALLPDNQSVIATTILEKIISTLKLYANTSNESYYNTFLNYKSEFRALNVSGLNGWGEAPGDVMIVNRNGTDYFVIPGLTFGNIFVAPEPQRGWESDIENLYHCTAVAPTHQYLAAYYYMQYKYSNAMVFVGRHATHEWLPGKEILLSYNDYGSIVVGSVPQLYFYISDGLGEAIQAKRRGFAVLISHLDSPMSLTHLYGNLTVAANLIQEYGNTLNPAMKETLANQIKDLVIANKYYANMGLNEISIRELAIGTLISSLNSFLKSTQDTLYPLGLHAIGQAWTDKDLASTVSAMMSYDFELANNRGKTNLFKELSQFYYSNDYANLTALEREFIMNKSYDISYALIYWNLTVVADSINIDRENILPCLELAKSYINLINASISNELDSMVDGLNGKYIPVNVGGEIITNPSILPTGNNMYQDQSSELPTQDAWNYAKTLALLTLADLNDTTEKIIMGIWCVETARDDGALVSVVLYLLGMKPVWTDSPSAGRDDEGSSTGKKINSMPEYIELEDLVRPDTWANKRIDVTVITSGLFRDLYNSQGLLMDNAFRVALARSYYTILNNKTITDSVYGSKLIESLESVMNSINYYGIGSESLEDNYVAKHWISDCLYYLGLGYNTTYAGECAITRIFAPPNGDYGAGISKLVSMSWTWNDTDKLSEFYLGRMGNMYSKNYWGDTNPIVFMRALSNADTIIVSRNTNQYGVLDNDDFFDYWGGLSMTVEYLSGKTPNMNVLMYANKNNPYIASFETVMYNELATRYLNPNWILGMMGEGYSGSRYMSNKFISNLWGWQVTRPSAVQNWVWQDVYNTYYQDKYGLGVKDWLMSGNMAYSMISMSGTMLNAAFKGYWNADEATLKDIANTWAQATVTNGVACCDCSCGNIAMMQWAIKYVNPDLLAQFQQKLYEATQNNVFSTSNVDPNNPNNPTSPNPTENSNSSSTVKSDISASSEEQSGSNSGSSSSGAKSQASSVAESSVGTSGESGSKSNELSSSSSSDLGDSGASSQDAKKAVEVSKSGSTSSSKVGMSIPVILCIIGLVVLVGIGYVRARVKR